MSQHPTQTSRRNFIATTAAASAAVGLTATATNANSAPTYSQSVQINEGDLRFRGIATGTNGSVYLAGDTHLVGYDQHATCTLSIALDRPARCLAIHTDGSLIVGFRDHIRHYSPKGDLIATFASLGKQAGVTGIALLNDNIIVADAGQRTVWRLDSNGAVINKIKPGATGFDTPRDFLSVSTTSNGHIHVNNPGRHRIETYTLQGERLSTFGSHSRHIQGFGGCCNPVSLCTTHNNQFVTAERGQPRVKLYDDQGQFLIEVMGPEYFQKSRAAALNDQNPTCRTGGLDVAIATDDRIWVLDRTTSTAFAMQRDEV